MTTELTVNNKNEIILYQPDNSIELEVVVENETVWLSQSQMGMLFGRNRTVIGRHIRNIFEEGELDAKVVCANFAHTTQHGAVAGKTQTIDLQLYNLDVIISVGYRVKSQQGTKFRIWATKTLKDYLLRGYAVNQRLVQIDDKLFQHEQRLLKAENQIDFIVRTEIPPREGIFYNGQIFDAFVFVCDLIKSAKKEIILIDNYIDESVLLLLSKRNTDVKPVIYTAKITSEIQLDLQRHNTQYPEIFIAEKPNIHDRFLLIDSDIYHIGASFKDLGKRLFGFNKMGMKAEELLKNI